MTPFSQEQFISVLSEKKPKEIFNSYYSLTRPCWVITEYLGDNKIKYFSNGWQDRTPIEESIENLYIILKRGHFGTFDKCFIKEGDEDEEDLYYL